MKLNAKQHLATPRISQEDWQLLKKCAKAVLLKNVKTKDRYMIV